MAAGQSLAAGQLLGLTGQYGNGNSDPHVHYDFRWDGDEPGTYPFAADAYLRDYPDAGIPVAGGYQSPEEIARFAELMQALPKPILAFCRSGARSTRLYLQAQQV